ncbi:MAG TPA: glycosyltransferase family 1 protein [Patescibacteria group bacterium]|nr:glycosyltransferase family 1 protein [Patescibacteria group bacterium]
MITTSNDVPKKFRKSKRFEIIDRSHKKRGTPNRAINRFSYLMSYMAARLSNVSILTPLYRFGQRETVKVIESKSLDLMFYPTSSNLSFLAKVPSVVAIHDLMHRARPEFLEVSAAGRWENREYVYRNITKDSYGILVDSEVGKRDVINYYHARPGKIVVLPFLPPAYLDNKMSIKNARKICRSLKLPERFIFYPANFWPHKNHINLIWAILQLKSQGKKINLVLTGSKDADFSSFEKVFSLVTKHRLNKQVFFLGYVSNKEISAIYKASTALVMPTYFGPTNIPVLEAWKMGTPVIYSDIRGCREQLGNAGLLIDPDDPGDIADKILKVYTHPKLVDKLVRRGYSRLDRWGFKDFSNRIEQIILGYEKKISSTPNKNRVVSK